MADTSLDFHRMAREEENRIAATAAIGINAVMSFVHFQTSMLRIWAENFESTARNYERGVEAFGTAIEQQLSLNSEECGADRTRRQGAYRLGDKPEPLPRHPVRTTAISWSRS
jgi:hypothetical protein